MCAYRHIACAFMQGTLAVWSSKFRGFVWSPKGKGFGGLEAWDLQGSANAAEQPESDSKSFASSPRRWHSCPGSFRGKCGFRGLDSWGKL